MKPFRAGDAVYDVKTGKIGQIISDRFTGEGALVHWDGEPTDESECVSPLSIRHIPS